MEKKTYSVGEAAKLLGIGKNAAYEAVRTGEIPSIRFGKRLVIPRAAIARMLGGRVEAEEVETQSVSSKVPTVTVLKHTTAQIGLNATPVQVAYNLSETTTLRQVMKLLGLGTESNSMDWIEIPVQGQRTDQ